MPQTPENSKLLVISFDDPLRAQEFLIAAAGCRRTTTSSSTTR
jgi:hypothetical protein